MAIQEEELATLVVRMAGDSSQYRKMLTDAQVAAVKAADAAAEQAARIESFSSRIVGFANNVAAVLAAIGIKDFVGESLTYFNKWEADVFQLRKAMEATNEAAETEDKRPNEKILADTEAYKTLAEQMRRVQGISRETTFALLKEAESGGVFGEKAGQLAKNAVALSRTLGGEASKYMEGLIAAASPEKEGALDALKSYLPIIKETYGAEAQLAQAQKIMNDMFQAGANRAKTVSEQLGEIREELLILVAPLIGNAALALGRLGVAAGQTVLFLKQKFVEGLSAFIELVSYQLIKLKDTITEVFGESVGKYLPTWKDLQGTVGNVVTLATVIIANFGRIVSAVMSVVLRYWNSFAESSNSVFYDKFIPAVQLASKALYEFYQRNEETIGVVLTAIGIVAVLYGTYKTLLYTYALVNAALALLNLRQVAATALWIVWNGVILVSKGLMLGWLAVQTLYNIGLSVTNFAVASSIALYGALKAALSVGTVVQATYAAGTVLATAATWAWNTALAVLDALLAPATLVAFAFTLGGLVVVLYSGAAVLGVLGLAAWGVYNAIKGVVSIFRDLPVFAGPISHITAMFAEWNKILLAVVDAASVEMPLAFDILLAGVSLAVNQLRDLWPPLWTFIKDGFSALADFASQEFEFKFVTALINVGRRVIELGDVFGIVSDEFKKSVDEMNKGEAERSASALTVARAKMERAMKGFKVVDSAETKKSREEVESLLVELELAKWLQDDTSQIESKITDELRKQLDAKQSLKALDAVQAGSAAALERIEAFRDMFASGLRGTSPGGPFGTAARALKRNKEENDAVVRMINRRLPAPANEEIPEELLKDAEEEEKDEEEKKPDFGDVPKDEVAERARFLANWKKLINTLRKGRAVDAFEEALERENDRIEAEGKVKAFEREGFEAIVPRPLAPEDKIKEDDVKNLLAVMAGYLKELAERAKGGAAFDIDAADFEEG